MDTDDTLTDADRKRNAAQRQAQQVDTNDLRWLMASKQGRRVARQLLGRAGVYRNSFEGTQRDSQVAYREGRRSIGLELLGDITRAAPNEYLLMISEGKTE